MVNRTRIEGGGYSKHDIIALYDQQAGCNIIVDVLLYNHSAHCDEMRLSVEFVTVGFLGICRQYCYD